MGVADGRMGGLRSNCVEGLGQAGRRDCTVHSGKLCCRADLYNNHSSRFMGEFQ